ncbi:uncharacterized protein LOC144450384 [Glandiceps talaboti]
MKHKSKHEFGEALIVTRKQQKKLEQEEKEELVDVRNSGIKSKEISSDYIDYTVSGENKETRNNNIDSTVRDNDINVANHGSACLGDETLGNHDSNVSEVNGLPTDPKVLIKLQEEDRTLSGIRDRVVEGDEIDSSRSCFFKRNGLLYRKWSSRYKQDKIFEQIVVPKSCRLAILELAHDIPLAGHLGTEKTKDRRIGCEILGPLPRAKAGNRYLLVICDYATRFPEAIPIKNQETKTIVDQLITVFSRVGIPEEIITDQGTNFMSILTKQLCQELKISHLKCTAYSKGSNGLVERFNGTFRQMLRKYAREEPLTWDQYIPYLLFAYREVPQQSTGFSPFELLYGRPVRGPLSIAKEIYTGELGESPSVVSYIVEMQDRMKSMMELANNNLVEAQEIQKTWYDQAARQRSFNVGDKVLLLLPTSSGKLEASWHGPYTVTRRVNEVNYEIDVGIKRKRLRTFHVNLLKLWVERKECLLTELVQSSEDVVCAGDINFKPQLVQTQGWEQVTICSDLSEQQRQEAVDLLVEYQDIFSDVPGKTDLIEHRVIINSEIPIYQKPYRLPLATKDIVKQELDKMIEAGIVQPSQSPWASPIVLVPKKDGSMRFCTDYRKLNGITQFDPYPMPRIDEILDQVGQAKYISTLDLTKGYWQIPLDKDAR